MTNTRDQAKNITLLLNDWKRGNENASEALFEIIYPVLRKIVGPILSAKGRDLTLQTTDVLHEAFLKMVDQKKADWADRTHFFAVTAQLVRRIIIDYARSRGRLKRGSEFNKIPLRTAEEMHVEFHEDWLALDEALKEFSAIHPEGAKVVEMRYFGGLNNSEIATVLGIGTATVGRHWRFARAWLKNALGPQTQGS